MVRTPAAPTRLGREVARRRAESGWSLRELAERSGVRFTTIQAIESGRSKRPSLEHIVALAAALGCSASDLTGLDLGAPPAPKRRRSAR